MSNKVERKLQRINAKSRLREQQDKVSSQAIAQDVVMRMHQLLTHCHMQAHRIKKIKSDDIDVLTYQVITLGIGQTLELLVNALKDDTQLFKELVDEIKIVADRMAAAKLREDS